MGDGRTYFDRIYRRHYGDIRRFVGRRVAHSDVEDVTAEVFVVAWRRLADLPTDHRLLPWLYGVARRVLANEYRRAQRADALAERVGAQAAPPGEGHADVVADRLTVAAAFDRLRDGDREILRLVAWEELTSTEIAVVLGCRRTTAAMRINRAHRRLLKALRSADHVSAAPTAVTAAEGASA